MRSRFKLASLFPGLVESLLLIKNYKLVRKQYYVKMIAS